MTTPAARTVKITTAVADGEESDDKHEGSNEDEIHGTDVMTQVVLLDLELAACLGSGGPAVVTAVHEVKSKVAACRMKRRYGPRSSCNVEFVICCGTDTQPK